jgi:hypothetical protein
VWEGGGEGRRERVRKGGKGKREEGSQQELI